MLGLLAVLRPPDRRHQIGGEQDAPGVACKLETRKGAGHVWLTFVLDIAIIADWFDEHLLGKKE